MRFRLIYEGELKASQRDSLADRPSRLAEHKHAIRKVFHKQLKHLWQTNRFLSKTTAYASDYGMEPSPNNERVTLIEAVAHSHRENSYRFAPLVRKDWHVMCSLEILFLRHDPPGSVLHAGDLDNRIKTLIDTLRKPNNANELRGNEIPADGEDPFFCLLEDDKLVTGLIVESDRYLVPPTGTRDEDRRQVHVIVTADVRPYNVTLFNMSFGGS